MARSIQVRNVPESVHRILRKCAGKEGMSLSDYVLAELRELAERPTFKELLARIHRRAPVTGRISAARAVRAQRGR
jgi:acyl-CoA synthetase (AMP-forming)/AMP-acid ligase II